MKVIVTGFKFFNDKIDGGDLIDSGTVAIQTKFDQRRNSSTSMGKGTFGELIPCMDSQVIKRVAHLEPPFEAELVIERMGNGKTTKEVCAEIQPLSVKQAAPVPAAARVPS